MCKIWIKKYYADPLLAKSGEVKEAIRVMLGPKGGKKSASANGLQAACDGRISTRHLWTALLTRHPG